ncbi:hypothetical protein M0R45_003859 [Rubus argutus]|uniref:Uncharacterized protein n=1 Tax=Rubus argutus TaxID=59490 RepID=A0AAW1YG75_RUBAR
MNGGFMPCSANYIPLSPISFLERTAVVNGDKPSVVYGDLRFSWKETRQRCLNFASALVQLGVSRHDVSAKVANRCMYTCMGPSETDLPDSYDQLLVVLLL